MYAIYIIINCTQHMDGPGLPCPLSILGSSRHRGRSIQRTLFMVSGGVRQASKGECVLPFATCSAVHQSQV